MKMIEIVALDNGAHNNQTFNGVLPDGWAVIPLGMETVNFPFGEVEAEEINGIMTVTKWTPGTIPEPDPVPEPEPEPSPKGPTLSDRVTDLEDALAITDETAIELYEAMMAQEEINTAQDDALIELYEMIGG